MSRNQSNGILSASSDADLEKLVSLAISLGAGEAAAIDSAGIVVEDELASHCIEPKCRDYGLSPSCPPYVSGPQGFRTLQQQLKTAVVVRIIVPSDSIHREDNRELGRFLYELAATIEQEAVNMGYSNSRGFGGGSCKRMFCHEHPDCSKLTENGTCRYPLYARTSLSGYGINVLELVKACGWQPDPKSDAGGAASAAMSGFTGLILIG